MSIRQLCVYIFLSFFIYLFFFFFLFLFLMVRRPPRSTLDRSSAASDVYKRQDQLGISEVRLTGGEPLIRRDLETIVSAVRMRHPDVPVALTTNGLGLAQRAKGLAAAGLSRINVCLLYTSPSPRDRTRSRMPSSA